MFINRCIYDGKPIFFPIDNEISIVFGQNGSGKTLLLQELYQYFLDQKQNVIYLPDERIFDITEGEALRIIYQEKMKNPNNIFDKYDVNVDLLDLSSQEWNYIRSGHMQIVYMCCKVLSASENTVVLIDEPERNLHLEFQQTLISDLMAIPQITKIVAATHSPAVICEKWVDIKDCFLT